MRGVVQVWIVAFLCVGWVSALGRAATETPTAVIQQTTTQVLGILRDPRLQGPAKQQERQARLQAIGDQVFDWPAMAQSALAFHWRSLTTQQRQESIVQGGRGTSLHGPARASGAAGESDPL
jgi:ABC-type transporter MlaC component